MKALYLPMSLVLMLAACSGEENSDAEPAEEVQTEVSAPEGDELDPTEPADVEDAETIAVTDLVEGNIEDGTAVKTSGTVEEFANDVAFTSFILSNEGQNIYIRNMAETEVELGDSVQVEGIYDGNTEENMPLISASVITVE